MEDYRYMVWNDLKKEYQFSNICETTEKGANTLLFKTIGNDARKWRFIIVKLEKEEAYKIRKEIKWRNKCNRIHQEIPKISRDIIMKLIKENDEA